MWWLRWNLTLLIEMICFVVLLPQFSRMPQRSTKQHPSLTDFVWFRCSQLCTAILTLTYRMISAKAEKRGFTRYGIPCFLQRDCTRGAILYKLWRGIVGKRLKRGHNFFIAKTNCRKCGNQAGNGVNRKKPLDKLFLVFFSLVGSRNLLNYEERAVNFLGLVSFPSNFETGG